MWDAAEKLFEDEGLDLTETVVDELILRARGDERSVIRALLVELAELKAAVSPGPRRGAQTAR